MLYVTDSAYNGDVFSHLSSLVALEPLLAINAAGNWNDSFVGIWNEVTNVAGLYCLFLSETLAVLIDQWLAGQYATTMMVEPNAPKIDRTALRFFVHPPSNLEELREMVAAKEKTAV